MRFVLLFAAACALGCVAEAAVAPELGYVKLLTGEKDLKSCDGTICSKGCCPEPGFDCCHDGTHCANNVANCPGCPNDGVNTGGWCKENQDDFGELTEDDPCCQAPDKLYCNYDTDHAGKCEENHVDFCTDDGYTKCGSHCCVDADEVCCSLENKCVAINPTDPGTECDGYCGGDVCGPNAEDCCLPPKICCRAETDGVPDCLDSCTNTEPDPSEYCDPDHPNVSVICVAGVPPAIGEQCCPNGINACYSEDGTDINTRCPGTPCGTVTRNAKEDTPFYCVGDEPYCCDIDTNACATHLDDCTDPAPELCTDFGPGSTTCTGGDTYCCLDGTCASEAKTCTNPECTPGAGSPECTTRADTYCCADKLTCTTDGQGCTTQECSPAGSATGNDCPDITNAPYCCPSGLCVDAVGTCTS